MIDRLSIRFCVVTTAFFVLGCGSASDTPLKLATPEECLQGFIKAVNEQDWKQSFRYLTEESQYKLLGTFVGILGLNKGNVEDAALKQEFDAFYAKHHIDQAWAKEAMAQSSREEFGEVMRDPNRMREWEQKHYRKAFSQVASRAKCMAEAIDLLKRINMAKGGQQALNQPLPFQRNYENCEIGEIVRDGKRARVEIKDPVPADQPPRVSQIGFAQTDHGWLVDIYYPSLQDLGFN